MSKKLGKKYKKRVYIMKHKITILSCLFFVGLSGLAVTYYWGYMGTFFNELFWGSILISGASAFFIISDSKTSELTKLIFLFLYGIVLYLPSLLWSPNFFHFSDEVMQAEISRLVYEYGNTEIGSRFLLPMEMIRLYPGLPFLAINIKNITGLSIFYAAKFTIALIHSMMLIFIYLTFKRISTETIAFLGAFIYTTNINYTFFNSLFAYESLGLPLFILVLLMVTKLEGFNRIIVTIIFIASLTIVHPFSSYMLLIILFLISILMINKEKITRLFAFTLVIIFSYIIYMAASTIKYFYEPIKQLMIRVTEFRLSQELGKKYALDTIPMPRYEYLSSRYIYPLIIALLFSIGLYLLYKNRSKYLFLENPKNKMLIKTFIIFSILCFFLPLIALRGFSTLGRVLSFGYIGVSFISAIAMNYMLNDSTRKQGSKIVMLILFLLLILGSISIGNKLPWRTPTALIGIAASGDSTTTIDVFYAADWFKKSIGEHQSIFGDKTIGTVFGSYGLQNVDWGDGAFTIFLSDSVNASMLGGKSYIVVDRRISKLMPESVYYFDTTFIVNSSTPVPEQSLNKFNKNNLFSKIYTNGNIDIYNTNI